MIKRPADLLRERHFGMENTAAQDVRRNGEPMRAPEQSQENQQQNETGCRIQTPNMKHLRSMLDATPETVDMNAVIGRVGEVAPLLECKQINAVCTFVDTKPRELPRWSSKERGKRYAIYFRFRVVELSDYKDLELMMYCRWNPQWEKKGIDYRSKLWKCACVAAGRRLDKREQITPALFMNKTFLCDVAEVGEPPATYSAIETITKKIAG